MLLYWKYYIYISQFNFSLNNYYKVVIRLIDSSWLMLSNYSPLAKEDRITDEGLNANVHPHTKKKYVNQRGMYNYVFSANSLYTWTMNIN